MKDYEIKDHMERHANIVLDDMNLPDVPIENIDYWFERRYFTPPEKHIYAPVGRSYEEWRTFRTHEERDEYERLQKLKELYNHYMDRKIQ